MKQRPVFIAGSCMLLALVLTPVTLAQSADVITDQIGMELRLIPAGSFMMGSDTPQAEDDEKPLHRVFISESFYIGIHEVTRAQFERVMGTDRSGSEGPDLPVDMVSWEDAVSFCRKLSELTGDRYRLPTEAEWEYAARAGTSSEYYWGGEADRAWAVFDTTEIARVGSRRPNRWGLYDMSGNVWEWCSDRYDAEYYRRSPQEYPEGPTSGDFRVLRGGSWRNGAANLRIARRGWNRPDSRHPHDGFRVVMEAQHPIMSWEVTGPYHTDRVSQLDYPESHISRATWLPVQVDSSGLVNLGDQIDREQQGSAAVITRHVFFAPHDQIIDFNFGFADTIVVFFNNEALFLGRNAGDLTDPAFSRDHRCSLNAREGLNEILFVVRSASDVWGFAAGTDIRLRPPPGDSIDQKRQPGYDCSGVVYW
ncbi:formylglycine-generating enzyme family protein [Gemmatimonadota bacterium]